MEDRPTWARSCLGGPVRFVLGGSGPHRRHRQPAGGEQVRYWTNDKLARHARRVAGDGATQHEGSWWTDWQAWIDAQNGGEKVPARVPGDGKLKAIEDAPGSYVELRAERAGEAPRPGSTSSSS